MSFASQTYGREAFGAAEAGGVAVFALGVATVGSAGNPIFSGQTATAGVRSITGVGAFTFVFSPTIIGVSATAVVNLPPVFGAQIKGVRARGLADVVNIKIGVVIGLFGWSGFLRRTGPDYVPPFLNLLPQGIAWPKDYDNVLTRTCKGLANVWGYVDGRAADLLEIESDPRKTHELLTDWERNWGLPDPCLPVPTDEEERRVILVEKITRLGAQSRQFFWRFSKDVVKTNIYIQEFSPFTCGWSQCGDTRPGPEAGWEEGHYRWEIGRPEIRFYWRVRPLGKTLHWFRTGRDNCGEDPMCDIRPDIALECILRRLKPAMTDIVFDYSLSIEE